MNEEKIQFKISDCPKLKEDIEKMQNSYQQEINKLQQELDKYKNNWEELKKWLDEIINDDRLSSANASTLMYVLDKMKELEKLQD